MDSVVLAASVQQGIHACNRLEWSIVEHEADIARARYEQGRILRGIRSRLGHGTWLAWLEEHCRPPHDRNSLRMAPSTARLCVAFADALDARQNREALLGLGYTKALETLELRTPKEKEKKKDKSEKPDDPVADDSERQQAHEIDSELRRLQWPDMVDMDPDRMRTYHIYIGEKGCILPMSTGTEQKDSWTPRQFVWRSTADGVSDVVKHLMGHDHAGFKLVIHPPPVVPTAPAPKPETPPLPVVPTAPTVPVETAPAPAPERTEEERQIATPVAISPVIHPPAPKPPTPPPAKPVPVAPAETAHAPASETAPAAGPKPAAEKPAEEEVEFEFPQETTKEEDQEEHSGEFDGDYEGEYEEFEDSGDYANTKEAVKAVQKMRGCGKTVAQRLVEEVRKPGLSLQEMILAANALAKTREK